MKPMTTPPRAAQSSGFTLIELLIAIALAAILGLLAYPSFQSLILKARRSDARAALMQLQQQQERWRAENSRYADLAEMGLPATSALGHYRLAVRAPSRTGYQLLARATGQQANDAPCRVMRIVQAPDGTTYSSGPDDTTSNPQANNQRCWPQ